MAEPLVEIRDLVKEFPVKGGVLQRQIATVNAVAGANLNIEWGETIGLVGESGCGKTTLGRLLVRLIEPTSGTIRFGGEDITHVKGKKLKPFRRRMQIIFQDPFSSLDPRAQVGQSIAEGLRLHGVRDKDERHERVKRMLDLVGLRAAHAGRYPHEFSGGQRQRIGIARALILEPDFVVADEPVSALDVSVQAQVLNLLKELQSELKLTLLFVAHNLAVVEHISDRVAVMYLGRVVELTDRESLYREPLHPYTDALLSAIPIPDPGRQRNRTILQGEIPSPMNPPPGCHFHTRCPIAQRGICDTEVPTLQSRDGSDHQAACHLRTGDHQHLDPTGDAARS
ncbi:MAG: ATP-binding cassette domain-containing protein [Acidimicrobiia bacterium]|nr:ATP-binding cassette domain-containing protein [Acidimicrobiia bacterium]NNF89698.1 ATP-binding cassette domain-containing protein [Acidimicrobiia bacterium]NNL14193.1 ATP-binding cassette domain-containing protein [Acidimicrobiia bacterium]NNL96751.1 ATP-binding cassette domain-containing protein [Acidimicrobiia bacterium]